MVLVESTLYTPVHSAGHEGQSERVRPVVELLQEVVHQLGSLAEEAWLQQGDAFALQRPKQLLPPAEEGLVAEEAAQTCLLGHHVGAGRVKAVVFWDIKSMLPCLIYPSCPDPVPPPPTTPPRPSWLFPSHDLTAVFPEWNHQVRNALPFIQGLNAAHGHILFGFVCVSLCLGHSRSSFEM